MSNSFGYIDIILLGMIAGFIILRWLDPTELGMWQSFSVFVGYLQILTLGTTSGLNRELPYWFGKGKRTLGMKRLKTAGYFTTKLSFFLMLIIMSIAIILYALNILTLNYAVIMIFAFSIGALSIQTNFLGATYRSTQSFDKLSKIQFYNSILFFLLLPLIYFFDIWGYIAYQTILTLALYLGYQFFRPFKVEYKFEKEQFIELVKIGLPMYIWNYLASLSRSIPRLILILFGSPLLVGLFSPAGSINSAMLNLPGYINRYLFPKISFQFGKNNDVNEVYQYVMKASLILFLVMMFFSIILALIIPYIFEVFFPKYIEGIVAAQITLFSGVFYSINSLLHITLNSIKAFKPFKFIVSYRLIYISLFSFVAYYIVEDLLIAVSIGAVMSEFFNVFNYIYFLKKARNE